MIGQKTIIGYRTQEYQTVNEVTIDISKVMDQHIQELNALMNSPYLEYAARTLNIEILITVSGFIGSVIYEVYKRGNH